MIDDAGNKVVRVRSSEDSEAFRRLREFQELDKLSRAEYIVALLHEPGVAVSTPRLMLELYWDGAANVVTFADGSALVAGHEGPIKDKLGDPHVFSSWLKKRSGLEGFSDAEILQAIDDARKLNAMRKASARC